MQTRRSSVEIEINGKNITEDLAPFLTGFSYTDVLEGESNTAQINLHDRERIFIAEWFPTRGDTATVSLLREGNSENPSSLAPYPSSLNLGEFEIDEIENKISSSGNTCAIKLNSIANKSELRSIDKSRSWEKVKLSKIAKDLATEAGLELFFDTAEDPQIERAEQKEISNLKFLHKLCKDNGLCLRVANGKVIVFDAQKYEANEPVKNFSYGDGEIISFNGRATISKIYKGCRVKYQHGKQAEKIEYTYNDKNKSDGLIFEINKKVDSPAEAEKLAKKELRKKNEKEIDVKLKVVGDFIFLAGQVISLEDFGFYDGNYIIEKATHSIGSGYNCDLELRKCLTDY